MLEYWSIAILQIYTFLQYSIAPNKYCYGIKINKTSK